MKPTTEASANTPPPHPLEGFHYALIDRLLAPHEALPAGLDIQPLVPPLLRDDEDKMPGLIRLANLSAKQRQALEKSLIDGERSQAPQAITGLLELAPSPAGTAEGLDDALLVDHLSAHLLLDSPQGQCFLRYYDGRVFWHLMWMLTPAQRRHLFGSVTRWLVYPARTPRVFLPPQGELPAQGPPPHWQVNASQRFQIERIPLINHALARFALEQKRFIAPLAAPETLARHADEAIRCAQIKYGLASEEDLRTFAVHALRCGAKFHEQAYFQSLLASLGERQIPYSEACAALSDEDWVRLTVL